MKVFVDTWGLRAIFDPRDSNHDAAILYRDSVRRGEADVDGFVTSDYIIDEALTMVRIRAGHREAVTALDSVLGSPFYRLVEVDSAAFQEAADMFRKHSDKEWSLTDCVSFVVMRDRAITKALTADAHFSQAGFEALLQARVAP